MAGSIEAQAPTPQRAESPIGRAPRGARRAAISLAALALTLGAAAPAADAAVAPDELDVRGASLLTRGELDGYRGGFSIGPFLLNLGVQITTTVNNAVTVQTVLSFDPATLAANITANAMTAASAAAAAGAAAASAGAAIASNAGTTIVLGVTQPQVMVAGAAGNPGPAPQAGIDAAESLPIPIAGNVVGQSPEPVAPSGIGDYLPSMSAPSAAPSAPVETAPQLIELALNTMPPTGDAPVSGTAQAAEVQAVAPPSTGLLVDAIADALPDTQASAATGAGTGAGTAEPPVTITPLANGALFDLDGTLITHQVMNGILASIQNSANSVDISQTVQMTVDIKNFASAVGGAAANLQAASLGGEIARFSSTLGN